MFLISVEFKFWPVLILFPRICTVLQAMLHAMLQAVLAGGKGLWCLHLERATMKKNTGASTPIRPAVPLCDCFKL
jgi:hypothetical protein